MKKTYYGKYSDGNIEEGNFSSRENAVKHFMKDVFGRILKSVNISNGTTIWTIKDGFSVMDAIRDRMVKGTDQTAILKAIEKRASSYILSNLTDKETGTEASALGISIDTNKGIVSLKDEMGATLKAFEISVNEIQRKRHKFGADFKCENCGVSLYDAHDPSGFCEI